MNLPTKQDQAKILLAVLVKGNLAGLTDGEKVSHLQAVCDSIGLNPLTKPFDYIEFRGKVIAYLNKEGAEQLRALHNISIRLEPEKVVNGCLIIKAIATRPDGRSDEAVGSCSLEGLKGDLYANAYMKAESRAKRRVTLSICGLGFFNKGEAVKTIERKEDETFEVEVKPIQAKPVEIDHPVLKDEPKKIIDVVPAVSDALKKVIDTVNEKEWPYDKVTKVIKERYKKASTKELTPKELEDLAVFLAEVLPFEV